MSLIKEEELKSGVSANYWMIAAYRVDKISKEVEVTLSLFKDAEVRGVPQSEPLKQAWAIFPLNEVSNASKEVLLSLIYPKLKELDQFSGAIDG